MAFQKSFIALDFMLSGDRCWVSGVTKGKAGCVFLGIRPGRVGQVGDDKGSIG